MPTIPLTQGQRTRIDWRDYRELSKYTWQATWSKYTKSFYARRTDCTAGRHRTEAMHRHVLGLTFGDGRQTDHKNHDTLDNRRSNLRILTSLENGANQRNQSKYGVGILKDERAIAWPFSSMVQVDGCRVFVGLYATAADARAARERYLKTGEKKIGRRSPYGTGITKAKRRARPFRANARRNGRHVHLGMFSTAEDARKARADFLKGNSDG